MPVTGNLIANGGFERGLGPWFAPRDPGWEQGDVSSEAAHGGGFGLRTLLRGSAGDTLGRRWGAMFEVGTVPFPRHVSLWYRVDRWGPANALQYLLFAVLVGSGPHTFQLRYILAGMDTVPYNDKGNVRFVLVRKGPPRIGAWIRFTTDLHQEFQQRWDRVPRDFEWLRFAIEARYDTRGKALDRSAAADVSFDDVFVGYSKPDDPAGSAPDAEATK
jgi:hypothetical protein